MSTLPLIPLSRGTMPATMSERPRNPALKPGSELVETVEPALEEFRSAIHGVMNALPQPVRKPADVRRMLGLDTALGWSMYQVFIAPTGLAAGPYVPTPALLKRFVQSAMDRGIDPPLLSRVHASFERLDSLVLRVADDRATFISMIRDVGVESGKDDVKHKRAAYRANRHLCGFHADLVLHAQLFHPSVSENPDLADQANITGCLRIKRTRLNTTLLSQFNWAAQGSARPYPEPVEPDETHGLQGWSFVRPFCSSPLPDIQISTDEHGLGIAEIHSSTAGNAGDRTYFFASVMRDTPLLFLPDDARFSTQWRMVTPCEAMVRDLWMHKSAVPTGTPSVRVYWPRGVWHMDYPFKASELLPVRETVLSLGQGLENSGLRDLPQYPSMVRHVADKLGWNIEDFHLFRCRVEYPMMHAVMRLDFQE